MKTPPVSSAPSGRTVQPSKATLAYRTLRSHLWQNNYFTPNPTYYLHKHLIWISLILLSITCLLLDPNFFLRVIFSAACLGLGLQQAAFLAHDAAHNSINEPPKKGKINWLSWFLGSCVFGISIKMWTVEHSLHHAITIRPREDPQFNYLPIWMLDLKELENEKVDGKGGKKPSRSEATRLRILQLRE
ncbi:hypothetical protein TL16_g03901 [Triparma laevis f. inornata]|uniref:Fatty acid desaturase domain-containing protein n=1 Tax=Triparma laevis f. inornata TaxID=1714386 RepID=A0A9W7A4X8_9STRA|nr:hypothetical protein TL16_g03901 [Triparma laevis f. inornata]